MQFYSAKAQESGGKAWVDFDSQTKNLESDLQQFQNAAQELGSSLNLVLAIQNLHDCTVKTTYIPQVDTRHAYERSEQSDVAIPPPLPHYTIAPLHVELNTLADSIGTLREAMMEFPEFGDLHHSNWPLAHTEADLKYWSSCLVPYSKKYGTREVQIYIHDMSICLGEYFCDTSRSIKALTYRALY
ncbi:hypothetical protein K439DRAFT_388070 [Ramaria rubella]|nr:hypothetical protein K439DRAFT_388070 [Ramaria rubella]